MNTPAAPATAASTQRKGLAFGLSAYLIWGALPLYLVPLSGKVPAFLAWIAPAGANVETSVILAHRVVWSVVLLFGILSFAGLWKQVIAAVRDRRTLGMLVLSTLLMSCNWFVFTYCSTHGMVLQGSLGYFLNPIITALLGMIFLRERLRPLQWAAFALAVIGVTVLTVGLRQIPHAALVIAGTFAVYGLVRKVAKVDAVAGLSIETTLLLPIALAYLYLSHDRGYPGGNPDTYLFVYLMIGCGLLTTIPLLCFNRAAKLLPLSTLGFLQYAGPTCQFMCAVFAFGEVFTRVHAVAFGLIWAAVGLFLTDALRRRAPVPAAVPGDE